MISMIERIIYLFLIACCAFMVVFSFIQIQQFAYELNRMRCDFHTVYVQATEAYYLAHSVKRRYEMTDHKLKILKDGEK